VIQNCEQFHQNFGLEKAGAPAPKTGSRILSVWAAAVFFFGSFNYDK
jgi:hypothetical protein